MYVNNDILKEIGKPIPKTWDEFEATALRPRRRRTRRASSTRIGFAFTPTLRTSTRRSTRAAGTSWRRQQDRRLGRQGGPRRVLQMYERMNENGSGYSPKSFDYQSDLATGKLAFFFSSTSTVPFMKDLADQGAVQLEHREPPAAPIRRRRRRSSSARTSRSSRARPRSSSPRGSSSSGSASRTRRPSGRRTPTTCRSARLRANTETLKEYWTKDPQGKQALRPHRSTAPRAERPRPAGHPRRHLRT